MNTKRVDTDYKGVWAELAEDNSYTFYYRSPICGIVPLVAELSEIDAAFLFEALAAMYDAGYNDAKNEITVALSYRK